MNNYYYDKQSSLTELLEPLFLYTHLFQVQGIAAFKAVLKNFIF